MPTRMRGQNEILKKLPIQKEHNVILNPNSYFKFYILNYRVEYFKKSIKIEIGHKYLIIVLLMAFDY